jgi:carbon-monoxide dehydrogenase large subunit
VTSPNPTGIGAPVPRSEDERLLTGNGEYSDDFSLPDQLHAFIIRSPHAHANVGRIDRSRAEAIPGVAGVLTGQDFAADGFSPMPAWGNPRDVALKNRDGAEVFFTPLYPLAVDRVRRVGEPVAVVVAETASLAQDAAELVNIHYEVLPAVTTVAQAMAPGAAALWDEVPGNVSVDDVKGDEAATDAAFAKAAHVVRLETWNQRVTGVPMEPRAAVADIDSMSDRITLYAGGQGVNRFQNELARTLECDKSMLRVVSRDVGGGYGTRNHTYPEFAIVCWAAWRMKWPVKWVATRAECFLSDYAGRDLVTTAEIALDGDGRILAMRSENIQNIGTHTISFVPLARGPTVFNGVYDIPAAFVVSKAVFTNQTATASYRGAGRPESMFVIERLMDMAACRLGIDRLEIRRRNLIADDAMPYANPVGVTYDSGRFGRSLDMAVQAIDWAGFEARRAEAKRRGRLRGIGVANYIETATGYPQERVEMTVKPDGTVDLVMGTQSSGQGHETTYAQIISDWLGVPFFTVHLRTGDTDFVSMGNGSHSSRSMKLAGHLYRRTTDEIVARATAIAAHMLEAAAADIAFADGRFTVAGTDRAIGLFDVAAAAGGTSLPANLRGPLYAEAEIHESLPTYPNGCHACEVEVDPDTGAVEIVSYVGVDDVGRVINPMIVDGQTHGGIAQGAGQALMEICAVDEATGQVLAGSFMDYAMPRADLFPDFRLQFNEVPSPTTALGVKGGGEGGTTAAPPALVNAICDAAGIEHIEMPVTPELLWRAMRASC